MKEYHNRPSSQRSRQARLRAQRRRRQQKLRRLLGVLFVLVLVFLAVLLWQVFRDRNTGGQNLSDNSASVQEENGLSLAENSPTPSPTPTPVPVSASITGDDLSSHYAIVVRRSTGETIFELRSQERMYPASMTKLMSALVAYEQIPDLQTKITLNSTMYDALYAEGASMAGFSAGEEVSAEDLLYGVLLPSGAECCIGLAEYVAGSVDAFVELMNQKAAELGMNHTHFCNPTGLHDENHYTTVSDLAILLETVLENDTLRQMATTQNHTCAPTDLHPEGVSFQSTLFEYMPSDIMASGLILGGKTGYTSEAGQCLASLGKVDGEEFLCVTGLAPGSHETDPYHIIDAYRCYSSITVGSSSEGTNEESHGTAEETDSYGDGTGEASYEDRTEITDTER